MVDPATTPPAPLADRLRLLHAVRAQLFTTTTADDLCRMAIELGRVKLGFDRLSLWFADSVRRARGSYGTDETGALRDERAVSVGVSADSPMGRIFTGETDLVIVQDATLHDEYLHLVGQGTHALAALWDGIHVLGSLSADNLLTQRSFTDDDGEVLRLYASIIGHLFLQRQAEGVQRTLQDISAYALTHTLDELVQFTLDRAEQITGSTIGFFHFFDEASQQLSLQTWSTNTLQNMCAAEGHGAHYPLAKAGVWVDCISERKPVIHNDYPSLPHRKGLPDGHAPIRRELVVPVMQDDRIVAVIGVGNKPEPYTEHDVELVSEFAHLVMDIIARKRAEEALRESEIRFRTLATLAPAGIYLCDTDGKCQYANTRWCEMAGLTQSEALDDGWMAGLHPEDREFVLSRWTQMVESHGRWGLEYRFQTREGAVTWVYGMATPLLDAHGNTTGYVGLNMDITDRKRAEEALRESEARYHRLFESAPIPIWEEDFSAVRARLDELQIQSADDARGLFQAQPDEVATLASLVRLLDFNPATLRFFDVDDREAIWRALPDYFDERSYAVFAEEIISLCGGARYFHSEITIRAIDGSEKELLLSLNVAPGSEESWKRIYVCFADITARKQAEAALRESEARWHSYIEHAPYGVYVVDETGKYLEVNPEACRITGYCADEFTRMSIPDLVAPEWQQEGREHFQRLLRDGVSHGEVHLRKKNGDVYWAAISSVKLSDTRYLGMDQDITAKKLALDALQESETTLQGLFNAIHESVFMMDRDGVILAANTTFATRLNRQPEDCIGRNIFTLLPPELVKSRRAHVETVFTDGIPRNFEDSRDDIRMRHHLFPVIGVGGVVDRLVIYAQDITERYRAEKALHESNERFDQLSMQSRTVVWEVDPQGVYTYVSPVAVQLYGYQPEEIVGRLHFYDLHPEEGRKDFIAAAFSVFDRQGLFEGLENPIVRKDGTVIWVTTHGIPLLRNNGELVGYRGSDIDITARKYAELEREQLQGQLAQLQKMESIGRLAGGVAHDFNNMLNVILGNTELALAQTDSAVIADDLLEIKRAAERSADLTRQLLAFARKQTVIPRVLDLNETIYGMLKMLRRLMGEDIELNWLPGDALWMVKIDPSQIDHLLANLCVNARDAISGNGRVIIETANVHCDATFCTGHAGMEPGDYVLLAVSDDGCGMTGETMAQIFEPFFSTKGVGEGTGLGLATVYGVVSQNQGFINVYSEPGLGAAFKIYLPRHRVAEIAPASDAATAPVRRGQETVLLVEDEPAILRLGQRILASQGYHVLVAATPGEAIRITSEYSGEIHLLMTDVVMPEMNGRDLARRLLSIQPSMKRLFMSGYTANVIASHGILDEGVNFLQKPFTLHDLVTKVREVLD